MTSNPLYNALIICAAILVVVWFFGGWHLRSEPCVPPPYDQCTPKGTWNAPNCACWDSK